MATTRRSVAIGKTLWATDFFTKKAMTLKGPVTYSVLFFIHLHSHRIHLASFTPNPDGRWMGNVLISGELQAEGSLVPNPYEAGEQDVQQEVADGLGRRDGLKKRLCCN